MWKRERAWSAAGAAVVWLGLFGFGAAAGHRAEAQEPKAPAAKAAAGPSLPRPSWKVGDRWVVETVTDRVQERGAQVEKSPAVRWQFEVATIEKLAGRDCFRIEVKCLAQGRFAPDTTLWVDAGTLTLKQLRTQIAVAGQLRTLLESYDTGAQGATPVLSPINALPIDLPAFLPPGSKGLDTFEYTSQPLPAGSKDPTILRFAHSVKQDVSAAGAKSLERLPRPYAKDLEAKPVVEVKLQDQERQVTQLWQQDQPWPLFIDNGRTRATLVSVGQAP